MKMHGDKARKEIRNKYCWRVRTHVVGCRFRAHHLSAAVPNTQSYAKRRAATTLRNATTTASGDHSTRRPHTIELGSGLCCCRCTCPCPCPCLCRGCSACGDCLLFMLPLKVSLVAELDACSCAACIRCLGADEDDDNDAGDDAGADFCGTAPATISAGAAGAFAFGFSPLLSPMSMSTRRFALASRSCRCAFTKRV